MQFNAWHDPWVPVRAPDGSESVVSLRDLYLQAHAITGLGSGLTPLDLDSLHRFLPAVGAVIARYIKDADWNDGETFSADAITVFGDTFGDRFNLTGERPFLQRWDRPQSDLAKLITAAAGKEVRGFLPIEQLHPHAPGGSSSQWAVRADTRDVSDPSVASLLLVTAWFQTKNGNGQDPWAGKHLKGSAGTWHTNPLAVHYIDPTSLARTIYANMPAAWLHRADLPLFLDRALPDDFATAAKSSVTRFTYAKTLPLLHVVNGKLTGFVLGADQQIDIPLLGKDIKESLGRVHEHDHTRLYVDQKSKKGDVTGQQPRGSFDARLSTTEGFAQWFRADRGIAEALGAWRAVPRVRAVHDKERPAWELALFSERTDGKGSRTSASWDVLPAGFASAEGELLSLVRKLLAFAGDCRWAFVLAGRTATGDSKIPAGIIAGQAAFYTALQPVLERLKNQVNSGTEVPDIRAYAADVAHQARATFDATTEPLITPRQIAAVAAARAEFGRKVAGALMKHELKAPDPKEAA